MSKIMDNSPKTNNERILEIGYLVEKNLFGSEKAKIIEHLNVLQQFLNENKGFE